MIQGIMQRERDGDRRQTRGLEVEWGKPAVEVQRVIDVDVTRCPPAHEQLRNAAIPQRLEGDECLGVAAVGVDVRLRPESEHLVVERNELDVRWLQRRHLHHRAVGEDDRTRRRKVRVLDAAHLCEHKLARTRQPLDVESGDVT